MILFTLYGELADLFGSKWILSVKSISEGIRAINANTNGAFLDYLNKKKYENFFVKDGGYFIGKKEELSGPLAAKEVSISPVIKGFGPVAKIVTGALLIGASFLTGGFFAPVLFSLGASLVLGGIVELLTPIPKIGEDSGGKQSYFFNNGLSTVRQGSAIPIGYGRMRVVGTPISLRVGHQTILGGDGNTSNVMPFKRVCVKSVPQDNGIGKRCVEWKYEYA